MLSNDGQITWGGIDTTNCDSNIHYVPLSSKTYWQFTFSSFSFGSFSINKNQQVISSSADAVFVVPSNVLSTIVTMLNATHEVFDDDGQWALPCNMSSTFPDLVYTINGQVYTIKGSDYIEPVSISTGVKNPQICEFFDFFSKNFTSQEFLTVT